MKLTKTWTSANLLEKYLEDTCKSSLLPDVSNYAKGRLRLWLNKEPMLFSPFDIKPGFQVKDKIILRLQEIIEWDFDYALVTYSGDTNPIGIGPHRDAGYAAYEAMSINVSGECEFKFWPIRDSKGQDEPIITILKPGDVTSFNCKHLHSANPTVKRWNINFWKKKKIN
jgi:hypothetical protein